MKSVLKNVVIICSPSGDGHNIEYIHHIYVRAVGDEKNRYVFLAGAEFRKNMVVFDWPEAENSIFDFDKTLDPGNMSELHYAYVVTRTLGRKIKQYGAGRVYVNSLILLLPFAPLLLPWNVRVCGILYKLYWYDENVIVFRKLLNKWKLGILSKSKVFEKVFVLNDAEGVECLNRSYVTDKFVFLPDPCLKLPTPGADIRKIYGIGPDKKLFVHVGALTARKGTLTVLESLDFLGVEDRKNFVFLFAGKVKDNFSEVFYAKVKEFSGIVDIIVKDEYCSFDYLASVFSCCDAVLIPYKQVAQSSGILGYASQFQRPVIAPDKGLIGRLVRSYGLGVVCDCSSPRNLAEKYNEVLGYSVTDRYCSGHTVETFQSVVAAAFEN